MNRKYSIELLLVLIFCLCGCTNTRYLTDQASIDRQHDLHRHRSAQNTGDVLLNTASFILSATLNTEFEISPSERAFKHITIQNESGDTLFVNMVTDIEWKEDGYCDIMGIVLPPKASQKLLVPYPAAYNVYFRTPFTEEAILEVRTDDKQSRYKLAPRIPNSMEENK